VGSPPQVASPGIAPFAGVTDASGNAVCNGTSLSSTYAAYANHNSQLLSLLDSGIIPTSQTAPDGTTLLWWRELHAQAFGVALSNQMARPVIDQLLVNSFFGCAYNYALTELGGSTACNYTLNPAYVPFQ
jgi:hypothetical protein